MKLVVGVTKVQTVIHRAVNQMFVNLKKVVLKTLSIAIALLQLTHVVLDIAIVTILVSLIVLLLKLVELMMMVASVQIMENASQTSVKIRNASLLVLLLFPTMDLVITASVLEIVNVAQMSAIPQLTNAFQAALPLKLKDLMLMVAIAHSILSAKTVFATKLLIHAHLSAQTLKILLSLMDVHAQVHLTVVQVSVLLANVFLTVAVNQEDSQTLAIAHITKNAYQRTAKIIYVSHNVNLKVKLLEVSLMDVSVLLLQSVCQAFAQAISVSQTVALVPQ